MMHLLGHFLVALLLFLGGSAFPDSLDATLYEHIRDMLRWGHGFLKNNSFVPVAPPPSPPSFPFRVPS